MSWSPSEKEIAAVLALDGQKRYEHFIKKVADEETVWSLWNDGWALAEEPSGRQAVPVWPHANYAERCAAGAWKKYQGKNIVLREWLERWTPGIEADRRLVAVFPTPGDRGVIVEASRLAEDLNSELRKYE